jgi:hypothetical protein
MSGHEHQGDARVLGRDRSHEFQSVHLGHDEVGDHDIRHGSLNLLQRLGAVAREAHEHAARFFEQSADKSTVDCVIVDDKNRGHEELRRL